MNFFLSMMTILSIFGLRSANDPGAVLGRKIWEYSRILKARNNLHISGTGGGLKDKKIRLFMVNYDIYKDVELDEARINIVKLTEFYLQKINSDPELRPLLVTNPFTIKNLELGISYVQPSGDHSTLVARSFMNEGTVFYSKYDETQKMLVDLHKETYEEALAIVNGKKVVSED